MYKMFHVEHFILVEVYVHIEAHPLKAEALRAGALKSIYGVVASGLKIAS
jgi:hypothetical protein